MIYNWNIIGHEKQLLSLERDIQGGNLSHAYLFSGPEQVGKYTVAKKMAHILQCADNYCHTCPTCIQVDKGYHSDTIELKNNGESIKIEEIRDIIARLNMSAQSRYKIFLAESIERLTLDAANCLLKTLEEPTPDTIFLFTTGTLYDIPQTILSRVRVVPFHLLDEKTLSQDIQPMFPLLPEEQVKEATSFALGRSGKAIGLLNDAEKFASHRHIYQELQLLLQGSPYAERFTFLQGILEDDLKINDFLDILLHVLRRELLKDGSSRRMFIDLIRRTEESRRLLKKNVNSRLTLENLLLHF